MTKAALNFYCSSKFSPSAEMFVTVRDGGGVPDGDSVDDCGGVRRQFLSDVLSSFCSSATHQLFEGTANRMRPIFKQSLVNADLMTTVGKIIGHSILLDCQGFPYLSPACYYFMAGHPDRALSCIGADDAGERLRRVIVNVSREGRGLSTIHYQLNQPSLFKPTQRLVWIS